jgi:Holliday junction resolvase RusA-like endonuclease
VKVAFTVYGKPQPQGSTKAFIPKGWKRPIITSDNATLKPWRQQLAWTAKEAFAKQNGGCVCDPIARDIPIFVRMDFYLERPVSLPKKFQHATKRPDWDKLSRAVCDSLTGIAITDDSQIVMAVVGKHYGQPERVEIFVATLREEFVQDASVQRTMDLFAYR